MPKTQSEVTGAVRTHSKKLFDKHQLADAFAYIEQKWPEFTHNQSVDDGTLIGLPFPYIVPSNDIESGFVFKEMYYWDSFFVCQGLLRGGHTELAAGMLENLIYLYKRFHIIPNGSRFYHTSRSQPPFLTTLIFDIYEQLSKDINWLNERLWVAEKEYTNVWMGTVHPNWRNVYKGLSRNYEINMVDELAEAESGWDMTPRFNDQCLSYLPIDLNSLLYKYETDFARGAELNEDFESAGIWKERARKRAETVTEHLWDEEKGFFFDFNYALGKQSTVWSLASYYPLWSGMATAEQAEKLVQNIEKFMHEGGLTTTASPSIGQQYQRNVPHQWTYPNGWAPLHWLVVHGLHRYGYHDTADKVTRLWLSTNLDYYTKNGVFREAYNVVDRFSPPKPGLYPPQLGFAWTNAVFVDLAKKFLTPDELELV
jgi:alpha,alpha-trehalase